MCILGPLDAAGFVGGTGIESTRDGLPLQDATICDLKLTRSYSKNRDTVEEAKGACTT